MSKKFAEHSQLNLSQVNKDVLKKWDENDVFAKSMTEREGCPSFVFYEGPPSANGMPGIHHVMARTIKDTFCRYKTMKGFQVKRKAGWDTHGLPVELGVEKALHITKEDIGKTISVAEYNAACRKDVMKFTKEWTDLTHKMGYWVDLENPYITYDNRYIETLWWLLKQLHCGRTVQDEESETRNGGMGNALFPGMDHYSVDIAFEYGIMRRAENRLCGCADLQRIYRGKDDRSVGESFALYSL